MAFSSLQEVIKTIGYFQRRVLDGARYAFLNSFICLTNIVLQVSALQDWFRIAERSESFSVPIATLTFVFETCVSPNSVKVGASVDTHLCLPKTKPSDECLSRRIIIEWNEVWKGLVLRKVLFLFSSPYFWKLYFKKTANPVWLVHDMGPIVV